MFQQNISTDDSIYYNHLKKKKIHGKGEGWVDGPFIPPGWECKQLRGFMCSISGRILKNLRATISEGKDKNLPEKLIDLGFFRLLKFSPRAT